MSKDLLKMLSIAVAAASLAACGSSDSDNDNDNDNDDTGSDEISYNTSANPSFSFDQTTYVGAVDPSASEEWYGFAMAGSYPAAATNIDTSSSAAGTFSADVTFAPSMDGITAASSCPALDGNSALTIEQDGTVVVDGQTFPVCTIEGTFTADAELTNTVVWSMVDRVNVGNGNGLQTVDTTFADTDLTIQAGTVFMNQAGSSMVVTRGSTINAVGTAAQPIVMSGIETTTDFGGDTEWGGLVLQGYAYNNKCGNPETESVCNVSGEGAAGYFGGFDNSDSSGALEYVIVTEAGLEIANGDELNGIGFMAVGYNTTVSHVQVHGNKDDGVEFFGGAVDATYLVLTGNQDDDIDWDEGYVGNIQHALVVKYQNQDSNGNHVFELDTAGDADESLYQESNPTVANVTAIVDLSTATYGAGNIGSGIHLKAGSEGRFFNSLLVGDVANCVYLNDSTVETTVAGENSGVIDSAFQNIHCGTVNTLENNGTFTLDSLVTLSSVTLNDMLAETAIGAVSATIASAEVDGTAD
ncbi:MULTISPECIES: hypothetical protein [unclassified Oceanobacter]|uniref:hypothetical protein n=1 Tax=unclassified Oceanobacter TaxID=2620260 RepID=UPI0026E431CD|nr:MULTISPECIES: hypothetical protein [unclassified Oceanobacter]MDO6682604.1 hypothetical protein [Oceanobacter sp. 5_MG-2023]MDP2506820.1 hypothetical protein [Oceanobacter sp. 3_MG-2023]